MRGMGEVDGTRCSARAWTAWKGKDENAVWTANPLSQEVAESATVDWVGEGPLGPLVPKPLTVPPNK